MVLCRALAPPPIEAVKAVRGSKPEGVARGVVARAVAEECRRFPTPAVEVAVVAVQVAAEVAAVAVQAAVEVEALSKLVHLEAVRPSATAWFFQ